MKCIILAAGYATRLYPLTIDKPKALLTVGGKTILEYILYKIEKVNCVDQAFIITNDRFYNQLSQWKEKYKSNIPIKVLNDLTTSNENRLGAIADIQFVLESENINDELIVIASDNLFQFELTDFVNYYKKVQCDCITVHELNNIEELKRTGVAELDNNSRVISFEEKPKEPKSNLAVPPVYIYAKKTLKLFRKYLNEGNNADAPGNFVRWLIKENNVYAFKFDGLRYDIGTLEAYNEVKKLCESGEIRF